MDNKIQDIFRKFGNRYLSKYSPNYEQRSVFNNIIDCRTKVFGGHVYKCLDCGDMVYSYNSCNNRHCPNCGDYKKEKWIIDHYDDILNVEYFHVVFTIPPEMDKIFFHNKKVCYKLIIQCASRTILELCKKKKYLGATPGIVTMLHTWSQTANYRPHVHMIVTGGGYTSDKKWIDANNEQFLPIKVMEDKFKNKLIKELRKEELKFYNNLEYLNDKLELDEYLEDMKKIEWICYLKKPFENVDSVYKYLSRYVYKVCMSDERIINITDNKVTFSYKDTLDRSIERKMSIKGEEYIRKYLLHVLPKSFMKIRYYGIYSGRNKKKRLKRIKIITRTKKIKEKFLSKMELLREINGRDITRCIRCDGKLYLFKIIKKKKPPGIRVNLKGDIYA